MGEFILATWVFLNSSIWPLICKHKFVHVHFYMLSSFQQTLPAPETCTVGENTQQATIQDLATMWCEKPSASSWCNNRFLIKNYNSILNPSKKSVKFWMLTKYHVVALCTVRVWMISGYSVECLWSMAACICPLWANNWSSWRTLRLWAEGQGDQW